MVYPIYNQFTVTVNPTKNDKGISVVSPILYRHTPHIISSIMKTYLLTGDIGGTNSRMGLYDASTNQEIKVEIYENEIHLKKVIVGGDDESNTMDGIFERKIIAPFLKLCWEDESLQLGRPEEAEIVASIAVCGPVRENKVTYMSNLPNVIIDGVAIVNYPFSVNIKVCKIINDFVAQGYGCLTLDPSEVRELYPNSHEKIDPYGPKVCVGAGTGLGVCYLTPDSSMGEGSYTCFPSEGGHVEWAPRDELEIELWKHLKMKFDYEYRISVERVVSGPGLVNCYEFLVEKFPNDIHIEWHEKFLNTKEESEKGKLVSQQAHAEETSLGRKAMEIMCG